MMEDTVVTAGEVVTNKEVTVEVTREITKASQSTGALEEVTGTLVPLGADQTTWGPGLVPALVWADLTMLVTPTMGETMEDTGQVGGTGAMEEEVDIRIEGIDDVDDDVDHDLMTLIITV